MKRLDELNKKLKKLLNYKAKINADIKEVEKLIQEEKENQMQYFELVYMMAENSTAKNISDIENKVRRIIVGQGEIKKGEIKKGEIKKGEIKKYEHLGLKKLAYDIKGNKFGYYVMVRFKQTEKNVNFIEQELRKADGVIKFITKKINEVDYYFND